MKHKEKGERMEKNKRTTRQAKNNEQNVSSKRLHINIYF